MSLTPADMTSYSTQSHPPTAFTISGLSKQDAYTQISTEISRLEGQIRSLYSLRNSLAPVSSLPTELLSKVFMHCCELKETGEFTNLRPEADYEDDSVPPCHLHMRLVVSSVSRQWRYVALGHKPLWNLVMDTVDYAPSLDYVSACITRCQDLYMDLRFPSSDLLQLLMSHLSEISYLKFEALAVDDVDDFVWPQSVPLLQSLVLVDVSARLLSGINPGTCLQLHSLELYSCFTPNWNFIPRVASTIMNLTIISPSHLTPTGEFLSVLESLPLLIRFEISNSLAPDPAGTPFPPHPTRLHLPRLRSMLIHESMGPGIKLMHFISAPTASIQISVHQTKGDVGFDTLPHTLQTSQGHVWASIHHLWCRDRLTASSSSFSPQHSLSIFCPPYMSPLLRICRHFNLDNLETLWTSNIKESAEVMTKLSQLTKLRMIAFESAEALEPFLAYMEPFVHNQQSTAHFSALQELMLAQLQHGRPLAGLYDVLAARKIAGVPLQKLTFVECGDVDLMAIASLQNVVIHVEISGRCIEDLLPPLAE